MVLCVHLPPALAMVSAGHALLRSARVFSCAMKKFDCVVAARALRKGGIAYHRGSNALSEGQARDGQSGKERPQIGAPASELATFQYKCSIGGRCRLTDNFLVHVELGLRRAAGCPVSLPPKLAQRSSLAGDLRLGALLDV